MNRSAILVLALALSGCKAADEPAWAVMHATLDPAADGAEGYLVWEFFSKKWKKDHHPKFHLCARVQRFSATPVDARKGCAGCGETWAVQSQELESDCAGDVATAADFAGPTHLALGPVPPDLESLSPFPQDADAWYVGFDGDRVDVQGFAWPETVELSSAEAATRSLERWVLWPAYAWELEN